MKLIHVLIAVALLSIFNSIAFSATDNTQITVKVTKEAYVRLVGSLAGNAAINLTVDDVDNKIITLGTLGSESNTVGLCDVMFSSPNDFRFQHNEDPSLYLHGNAHYQVFWKGQVIGSGWPNVTHLTSCNPVTQIVRIGSPALPSVVRAGIYSDILRITIITQ